MARFERRKANPPKTQQPVGSIYSRNLNVSNNINPPNSNNNQFIQVIKKHDVLLNKLLKRFNDFENTIQAKMESLIEMKFKEEIDALQALKMSAEENNLNEQPEETIENLKVSVKNNTMQTLIDSLQSIQSNMLLKNEFQNELQIIKTEIANINADNVVQYQNFTEEQVRNISKWMMDMEATQKSDVIIEQYEKNKNELLNETTDNVEAIVNDEIKAIKKNVKLEINEKGEEDNEQQVI